MNLNEFLNENIGEKNKKQIILENIAPAIYDEFGNLHASPTQNIIPDKMGADFNLNDVGNSLGKLTVDYNNEKNLMKQDDLEMQRQDNLITNQQKLNPDQFDMLERQKKISLTSAGHEPNAHQDATPYDKIDLEKLKSGTQASLPPDYKGIQQNDVSPFANLKSPTEMVSDLRGGIINGINKVSDYFHQGDLADREKTAEFLKARADEKLANHEKIEQNRLNNLIRTQQDRSLAQTDTIEQQRQDNLKQAQANFEQQQKEKAQTNNSYNPISIGIPSAIGAGIAAYALREQLKRKKAEEADKKNIGITTDLSTQPQPQLQ